MGGLMQGLVLGAWLLLIINWGGFGRGGGKGGDYGACEDREEIAWQFAYTNQHTDSMRRSRGCCLSIHPRASVPCAF